MFLAYRFPVGLGAVMATAQLRDWGVLGEIEVFGCYRDARGRYTVGLEMGEEVQELSEAMVRDACREGDLLDMESREFMERASVAEFAVISSLGEGYWERRGP